MTAHEPRIVFDEDVEVFTVDIEEIQRALERVQAMPLDRGRALNLALRCREVARLLSRAASALEAR